MLKKKLKKQIRGDVKDNYLQAKILVALNPMKWKYNLSDMKQIFFKVTLIDYLW